jgi:hypothetical protein
VLEVPLDLELSTVVLEPLEAQLHQTHRRLRIIMVLQVAAGDQVLMEQQEVREHQAHYLVREDLAEPEHFIH